MHLLAQNVSTEHLAVILAAVSLVISAGLGILQIVLRSKNDELAKQSLECRYEHQSLSTIVARVEQQSDAILATQRDITDALSRVASVLDKITEKIDRE